VSRVDAKVEIITDLGAIDAAAWNALAGDNPFLKHEFLHALHETGCACAETGWAPHYVTLWQGTQLVGAMPLYLKSHSYGEYVFDWAWADAYYRHGHRYYPKLLCAVPFTPVTGARLLASETKLQARLAEEALKLAKHLRASSLHVLYPPPQQADLLGQGGLMARDSVQFHWHNAGYRDFDAFLSTMSHDKRKKIKQERRKLQEQGIEFRWFSGAEISDTHWRFFNRCYRSTYRQHHSSPYLSLAFFRRIGQEMPQHLLLVLALQDGKPIACALNAYNEERAFGRYWGSDGYVPGLHFETCYYQAIEFCIARGLKVFEGGVQGEHKVARGLLPVKTYSNHWLAHPEFAAAIADYLRRESRGISEYMADLQASSPFVRGQRTQDRGPS
jgi:uncharacterized protein